MASLEFGWTGSHCVQSSFFFHCLLTTPAIETACMAKNKQNK